jgi:hypothetical protein
MGGRDGRRRVGAAAAADTYAGLFVVALTTLMYQLALMRGERDVLPALEVGCDDRDPAVDIVHARHGTRPASG